MPSLHQVRFPGESREYRVARDALLEAEVGLRRAKWWLPPGWENPVIEVNVEVGGTFRFGMRQPGKQMFYALGTFTEVTAPERVACTWRWEPAAMFGLDRATRS